MTSKHPSMTQIRSNLKQDVASPQIDEYDGGPLSTFMKTENNYFSSPQRRTKTFRIIRPKSSNVYALQKKQELLTQRPLSSKRTVIALRQTEFQSPENDQCYFQPHKAVLMSSPKKAIQELNNSDSFHKRKLIGPVEYFHDIIEKRRRQEELKIQMMNQPTPEQIQQILEEERQRQLSKPHNNFTLVLQNKIITSRQQMILSRNAQSRCNPLRDRIYSAMPPRNKNIQL